MKKVKSIKRILAVCLIFLLSINSFAATMGDNDGSAFITKAEFDSLKNNFQSQIDNYNQSIDSKIDEAIASYLAGVKLSYEIFRDVVGYSPTGLVTVTPDFPEWTEGRVAWTLDYALDKLRTTTNSTHVGIQRFTLLPLAAVPFYEMNIKTKTAKTTDSGGSAYAEASGYFENNWKLNCVSMQWLGASSCGQWSTSPDSCNLMLYTLSEAKNKNFDMEDVGIAGTRFYHADGTSAGYTYALPAQAPEWGVTHLNQVYNNFCVNYKNLPYQRFVNESFFNNWCSGVSGEWDSTKPDGSRYHTQITLPWELFNGLDDNSYFHCMVKYGTYLFKKGDATRGFGLDMDETHFTSGFKNMAYFGFDTRFTTWDNLYTTNYDSDIATIKNYVGDMTLYDGHIPLWAGTPLNYVKKDEVITIDIPTQTDTADRNIFIKYGPFENKNPEEQTDLINYDKVKVIDDMAVESTANQANIPGVSNLKGFSIAANIRKIKFTADKDGFLFLKVGYKDSDKNKGGVWLMPSTFTAVYNK